MPDLSHIVHTRARTTTRANTYHHRPLPFLQLLQQLLSTHPDRSHARPHHGDPYESVHGGRVCASLPRPPALRSPREYLPHVARPLALLCAKFETDPSWMRSPVLRYVPPADSPCRELDRTEHPPRHDWSALFHPLQGVEADVSGAVLLSLLRPAMDP